MEWLAETFLASLVGVVGIWFALVGIFAGIPWLAIIPFAIAALVMLAISAVWLYDIWEYYQP